MIGTIDYTVPNRIPVPVGDSTGAKAIAEWMMAEVQYDAAYIDELMTMFIEISNGARKEGYLGTGNAYSLCATRKLVLLECEYVDSHRACLTMEQVSAALEQYRMFLKSDYGSPGFRPSPFSVEYLAEGEAARDHFVENGGVLA